MPFFASSYDEDKDDWTYVKYDDQLITQYYRLNTDYDKVKVSIQASYSKEMNSKIGEAITKISNFITVLQPQKAIVDILTSKAVGNAAVEMDSIINKAFSSKRDITKVMQFSALKGDKLLVKLSLPEQDVISNMFTIATRPTLFSLSDSVKYSVNNDATTLLSKKYTQTGDTIIDYIYSNTSLKDKFEDETDIVESVNKFCIDLSDNLQKDLGLNKLDRAIVLWAILQRHSWWSHSAARRPISEDQDMCELLTIEELKQTNLNIPILQRLPGRDAQIAAREKILFKLARALKNNNKQQISNLLENNIVVYDNTGSDELLDIYNYDDAPDFTAVKFAEVISKVKFTIFGDNRYDKKNVNLVEIKNVSIGSTLKKVTATIVFNPNTLKIMTITFNSLTS